jgi:excisionase family DNA binding protein
MARRSRNPIEQEDRQSNHEVHVPTGDELLTVSEVAKRLRVNTTTVRRWVMMGSLPAVILPKRGKRQIYRIKQQTLDTILQSPLSVDETEH